jgi:prolycopene isomerase
MMDMRISRRAFLAISAATGAMGVLDWGRIQAMASQMSPVESYPTVIIGAGLAGLCCGAYLTKMGIPVTMVESRDRPGGYATSFGVQDGRFNFEVSLHGMAARRNAVERILRELGLLENVELVPLREIYRIKGQDVEMSIPPKDPEAYMEMLCNRFPGETEGIRAFVREVLQVADEADRLFRKGRYSKITFIFKYPKIFKIHGKTLSQYMDGYIKEPALKVLLSSLWEFHGLPPSKVSALYYAVATGEALRNGTFYVKRRSQDLSSAMAGIIEGLGGRILYGRPAEEILVRDGAVTGVRLHGGEVIPAKFVVSNACTEITFRRLLRPGLLPRKYWKKYREFRPGPSTFIVWLGLRGDIRQRVPYCGVQVLTGRSPEEDYQAALRGEVERVPLRISIFDNIYEGYSNEGTSTIKIWALCGYEPWRRFESDYKAGRKEAYQREKERWKEVLIRRTEEMVIPGLSSLIEVSEASTPLTNWRYTGNTYGAIYGFEQSMHHAYIDRIDNRTPIKGLYVTGAWTTPGGGFWGVLLSGQMTFKKMVEDWGV